MSAFVAVLKRELTLAARRRAEWAQPLVFYAIVATMFALGAAPNAPWLSVAGPSILWVGAMLAALLSLERVFRADFEDGTMEQYFLSSVPASLLVGAKLLAQWMTIGFPLTLVAPLLGSALNLNADVNTALVASLLLGMPCLVLLSGFAAALTVALPRTGVLLPVLVLPLACPVVIFGAGAVRAAQSGLPPDAPLYFLGAILAAFVCGIPLAAAAALRNAID